MFVAFATPKTITQPTDVAAWRSPRRRSSLSLSMWRRQQDTGHIEGDGGGLTRHEKQHMGV
ncbi:hypothetical protein PR002_g32078 [Phytophthora rubi]|uniref:Uncharacterized protein n=1 Tax=Phytophthora rubi TaxID=129364 RepID=A0A6A3GL16_9STRA|nr:hypothetical protein PR002_g32078 [Phytophthora rubi]